MRKAKLYRDYRKQDEPEATVTWHCFGQVGDEHDGFGMVAIVEMESGEVKEIGADRLWFVVDKDAPTTQEVTTCPPARKER